MENQTVLCSKKLTLQFVGVERVQIIGNQHCVCAFLVVLSFYTQTYPFSLIGWFSRWFSEQLMHRHVRIFNILKGPAQSQKAEYHTKMAGNIVQFEFSEF